MNRPAQTPPTPWHSLDAGHCLKQLEATTEGLTQEVARQRLQRHGPNRLPTSKKRGPLLRLALQFHNVLLYVMIVSAVIAALLAHWVDAVVIAAAVIINAVIGFIQEGKAESALDSIRNLLTTRATVIRDGQRRELDATELVPGDVVLLGSGDKVPADLRLLDTQNLRLEEAALTGESLPVEKDTQPVEADAPLGDRFNMAYSGTLVAYGQGRGLVVETGERTQLGQINRMLADVESISTPLLRQMDRFGRWLAVAILALIAFTFALGTLWRGNDPTEMFVMSIALTAAAIPEGMPAIMTVMLALGVQRMARRKAIIRHLPAVETLGSVTVICSDKTGTLTRNEMTVQRVIGASHTFDVGGVGYAPSGEISSDGQAIDPAERPLLGEIARAGVLCNDARLFTREGDWIVEGDPTEGALLVLAGKCGLDSCAAQELSPRQHSIPFESEHRFMATLHHHEVGSGIYVKGAPERILEMCDRHWLGEDTTAPIDPDYWRRMANDTAARGLRVLAVARKTLTERPGGLTLEDIERGGFTLLGLVGIIDPPRDEAIGAVADCQAAGIRVKMITGDHADTARAIGASLGIGLGKPALTGSELSLMDDARLRETVMDIDVFARASPEHKLRLVQAMQACGQVVAMTGDGVNDAPALKRADVGVAMGSKGTEAAKEAADMILADDNFSTIGNAVREGRGIYANIQKSILFMLPTNGGEALVVIAAILFQFTLPLTPVQVLWINMVTACTLSLALTAEPNEPGLMHRPPRPPEEPLLSGLFVWRVVMVSLLMMGASLGLFLWELEHGNGIETARTMAVNAVVAAEMFYLLSSRHLYHSVLSIEGLFGNRWVLVCIAICSALQLLYTYTEPMQRVFGATALSAGEWLRVLAAGLVVLLGSELEKWLIRRFAYRRRARRSAGRDQRPARDSRM